MSSADVGRWGERRARRFLEGAGLHILEANWRDAEGEIDLVAVDGETVVFVEVKTRRSRLFGAPVDSLTRDKRRRLRRAALAYLTAHDRLDSSWRIDVVSIEGDPRRDTSRIEHLPDVVDADDESLR
ncbi:MAG TPA: YraN family protein [Anaerolineales bacterium]|nr:YraN family protein [Anaerolineales bacterium]